MIPTELLPILSITGSDGTGGSGIQADIKTCAMLGSYAVTVVSAITVQDTMGIQSTHKMEADVVDAQLHTVTSDIVPKAVKIGMLCDAETVRIVAKYLPKFSHSVLDCAFISSRGERIAEESVISEATRSIMPQCDIVIMKLQEAELLLGRRIESREAMVEAGRELLAAYSLEAVILRGAWEPARQRGRGNMSEALHNDLFATDTTQEFFTLPNHANLNTHGLAGTLSASIATYLAKKHTLRDAVALAYNYLQTLTVYSVTSSSGRKASILGHNAPNSITPRQQELYNTLMQLIANHSHRQHDVLFYADRLNITPRYLSQITMPISNKTPKQLISDALTADAEKLLATTTLSIQEIAFELGFTTLAQFTKHFKRARNVSPSEYRRSS